MGQDLSSVHPTTELHGVYRKGEKKHISFLVIDIVKIAYHGQLV